MLAWEVQNNEPSLDREINKHVNDHSLHTSNTGMTTYKTLY